MNESAYELSSFFANYLSLSLFFFEEPGVFYT